MPFLTDLATWLANVHADVTTKSAPNSITPLNVGGDSPTLKGLEGLNNLLTQLNALISAAGNLNAVLTIGNTSTLSIILTNAGKTATFLGNILEIDDNVTYKSDHYPDKFIVVNRGSSAVLAFLGQAGGVGVLQLMDNSAGFKATLKAGTLSAARTLYLPNESTGIATDDTLVTHTTKQQISVYSGTPTSDYSLQDFNKFYIVDGSDNEIGIDIIAGVPRLFMKDAGTGFQGVDVLATLSADRTYTKPNKSGTYAMVSDIPTGNTVKANADLLAQTALVPTVTSYPTPAADATYSIGGYIKATAYTSGAITFTVSFTDENGNVNVLTLGSAGSTAYTPIPTRNIRVKASTTIIIATGFSGTSTYDVGGTITFIAN